MPSDIYDVRCPLCDKLVFRDMGEGGKLQVKCPRCGALFEVSLGDQGEQIVTLVRRQDRNPKQWWAATQRRPGPEETK